MKKIMVGLLSVAFLFLPCVALGMQSSSNGDLSSDKFIVSPTSITEEVTTRHRRTPSFDITFRSISRSLSDECDVSDDESDNVDVGVSAFDVMQYLKYLSEQKHATSKKLLDWFIAREFIAKQLNEIKDKSGVSKYSKRNLNTLGVAVVITDIKNIYSKYSK